MPDRMQFSDDVTIGAQPSRAEIKAMAEDGVQTIINLRTEDEELQPMEPDEEEQFAHEQGLDYISLPISMDEADMKQADTFRRKLHEAKKPAFVHCKLAKRAGAFMMMDQAVREGWSGEETLQKAEAKGFECDSEKIERFVKSYVDSRADNAGGGKGGS
jgi:uncharacterized protein (TIGR01244 family)